MPKVLVVDGGYIGFDAAWHLEKRLRRGQYVPHDFGGVATLGPGRGIACRQSVQHPRDTFVHCGAPRVHR